MQATGRAAFWQKTLNGGNDARPQFVAHTEVGKVVEGKGDSGNAADGKIKMDDKIKKLLEQIQVVYRQSKHDSQSGIIADLLESGEDKLWSFLTSNSLWGGSGSIADQALIDEPELRRQLESLLIKLGEEQIHQGRVNVRTEMWMKAFRKWQNLR